MSKLMLRSIGISVAMATGLLAAGTSVAGEDLANGWGPSAQEISQTPAYCQKQFLSKHNPAVLEAVFHNCERINHFCPGLVLLNRAANPSIPRPERQRILRMGKGDIEYSLSRLTPSCNVWKDVKASEQRVTLLEIMLK